MTTTAFLYCFTSASVDNFADVIKKSIAGMEKVCGSKANTWNVIAIAITQNTHFGNRDLEGLFFSSFSLNNTSFLPCSTNSSISSSSISSYKSLSIMSCSSFEFLFSICPSPTHPFLKVSYPRLYNIFLKPSIIQYVQYFFVAYDTWHNKYHVVRLIHHDSLFPLSYHFLTQKSFSHFELSTIDEQ